MKEKNKNQLLIGVSEIPIIMGLSRFKTAQELFYEKLGLHEKKPQTLPMKIGTFFEDKIFQFWCQMTSRDHNDYIYQDTFKNKILIGHPDYYKKDKKELIEIKFLSSLKDINAYAWQINTYLGLSKIKHGYLVYLLNNQKIDAIEYTFSKEMFEVATSYAESFQKALLNRDESLIPLPYSELTPDKMEIYYDRDLNYWLYELREINNQIEELKNRQDTLKSYIKQFMLMNRLDKLQNTFAIATIVKSKRTELDKEALSKDIDITKYLKTIEYDFLKITFKDEKQNK